MRRYRVFNRGTREWWEGEVESVSEALENAGGWNAKDCEIKEFRMRMFSERERSRRGDGLRETWGWCKAR